MNTSVIFEDRQNNKLLINLLEVESVKVEIAYLDPFAKIKPHETGFSIITTKTGDKFAVASSVVEIANMMQLLLKDKS